MVELVLKLVGILVLLGCSHELKVSAASQIKFAHYLNDVMANYSLWLTQNQMDPTPPADGITKIRTGPLDNIEIECELRNQHARGMSVASIPMQETYVEFSEHYFKMYREIRDPIILFGNFECFGKIRSAYFPELNNTDVYFNGEGHFSLNTSSLDEQMYFLNVGVTENYALDYDQRYIDYTLCVNSLSSRTKVLNGRWNDSLVTNYLRHIEDQFIKWYEDSLDARFYEWKQQAHPLFGVYKTYLDIKTKDFDLKTLLSEDELPLPYKPTPIPTTTPESTTEMATTTTSESTTPNNSATKTYSIFTFAISLLCVWSS